MVKHLTTATFVVTLGLFVGTVTSVGPASSVQRLRQGIGNVFVSTTMKIPNRADDRRLQLIAPP